MKWLDKFIVSERGQWDHPGKPTAVPTKDGRITMQGVPYPVFAMDETGYGGMIYPGGNYQFPGKMVYEIPMAYGGDISIPDLSRPNWLDKAQKGGVYQKIYTDPLEFAKANQAYNDSLTVYNAPKTSYDRDTEIRDAINNSDFQKAQDLLAKPYPAYNAFRRLTILNHKPPQPVSGYPIYLGFNPSDPLVPKFKKPTQKPVYKEKPKEYIPTKTVKLEREPLQLVMPQSNRILDDYNNTRQVLRGIQEEDKSNQNLYPTRVVPAPDFRHGGSNKWLDMYQGDKSSSQVSKSLVDPETGVVTNINTTDEPPYQWTSLEDQYGIKPSAQKRTDYVPYKDVSGAPYESQDPYAHNYNTVDVPKNLSELPSYRLYAMGVSGNSSKPFSPDWTTGRNLNDAGYVKFDEKTGYNYQPSRKNLQDFQSLPMEGEKAFNLRRFVLNPYEGQPQTHDAYVKKDGTVDKENFIPKSYSREETMDNVFKDLYAQNLYKFKGDRDAAYNATSEFMTERVEPQYRGKYYEYMNNPNVSERDKLNINRVGSHMTVDPIQTEESVSQGIADKLAEEHPEYLTNEDLDFDKAIRADPRYREKLNEYNEVLQDWYVTNKNMSPDEAKALVEKDLYKNVPKRKTTYATFKTGGWLEEYQGDKQPSQVKQEAYRTPWWNPEKPSEWNPAWTSDPIRQNAQADFPGTYVLPTVEVTSELTPEQRRKKEEEEALRKAAIPKSKYMIMPSADASDDTYEKTEKLYDQFMNDNFWKSVPGTGTKKYPFESTNDTIINLTDKPMGWFGFNEIPGEQYTDILGNNYVERKSDNEGVDFGTGRPEDTAGNWIERMKNPDDTFRNKTKNLDRKKSYYHSKDIPAFYGIEGTKFKVGKASDFSPNTIIVPVRNSTVPYSKVDMDTTEGLFDTYKSLYTYDTDGNKQWNLGNKEKFLVHSPETGQTIFLSSSRRNEKREDYMKTALEEFQKNNPGAYIIALDEGRFDTHMNDPKGLSETAFKKWTGNSYNGNSIYHDFLTGRSSYLLDPKIDMPIDNDANPNNYGYNLGILKQKYGGWLDSYQGDEGSSQVKTYASDPNYFDNRAVFVDNPQANDLVRSKVYAGTHGWDPSSNSLVKLDKPIAVPEAVRQMSTADWGKKTSKERFESDTPAGKATRKAVAAREMEQAVTNPYFRGAIPAMLAAPAIAAAGPSVLSALNAPAVVGSTTLPAVTAGNILGAGFAADAVVNRLPQIPGQLSRGEYLDAAINAGTGALDLFGAGMVSPLFKGVKAAKKLPGSPNSGNVVDELREELQREGIVQSQKTLNLPWKNIIRKGVNPWTYDIPNKVDDIKSLIFSKIKNPAYTEPDEIERQYQMYKKFLVKPGEKVLSKDDYVSGLDPDMFFRTRKEVVNNRFNTRFSENQTRGIKNRYTTWDMYLGKPQIENPMYDISHLTKSKDDVIYTIKEDFMDKPAIENRLAHVIGDIETGTAATHRPVAKKTGDNKWIHLDNDSYFGGMGGFHWDIKKLPNGNYEAYANDVWDLQPFKGRDLPKSIQNIEVGKALGIGKPLNVKVGFEIDKDTKKILKTYGMAPGAIAGAAALQKEKYGGGLDKYQVGSEVDCPDGNCRETDQIQAIYDNAQRIPERVADFELGVAENLWFDPSTKKEKKYLVIGKEGDDAREIWKQHGVDNFVAPSCMYTAGLGWRCAPETKDYMSNFNPTSFNSNTGFIDAVNKGTLPFNRVIESNQSDFDSQKAGNLKPGDIVNFKGPGVSHGMTFTGYDEKGNSKWFHSPGSPSVVDIQTNLWKDLRSPEVKKYINRFDVDRYVQEIYNNKIQELEKQARENPTYYKKGGVIPTDNQDYNYIKYKDLSLSRGTGWLDNYK